MPKDGRVNSSSPNQARVSLYARSSKSSDSNRLNTSLPPSLDQREWEEARCPACIEHPHNAVLLICSSREKGCRPYMCDTSYRHSNCLDQFRKSFPMAASTALPVDESVIRTLYHRGRAGQTLSQPNSSLGGQALELVCPLCRGQIRGLVVVEDARRYMNSKIRSCSLESCDFSGNYSELRKHARSEHPFVRPAEADPKRQSDWAMLERQRDVGDTLSAYQSQFGYDLDEDDLGHDLDQDLDPFEGQLLRGNLFDDFFGGIHSEAEDERSEDGNLLIDMNYEVEFSFSFLNEFSFCPWADGGNFGSARTRSNLLNGRSTSSRSRSNYHRETTTPSRNATMPSRNMPNSSPQRRLD